MLGNRLLPSYLLSNLKTVYYLPAEHIRDDHLLPQKGILRNQVFSAAKEIGHHPLDRSIKRGLSPGFHLHFDRLKTTHQPLFAFVPEVFQTCRWFAFGVRKRN